MDVSQVIASGTGIAALLISTYTLWKTYLQKGRLGVVPPRAFAMRSSDDKTYLILPLLFYNSGALPVIVFNLRLRLASEHQDFAELYFSAIKRGFYGDANDKGSVDYRIFAVAFPVMGGRDARTMYCEFQSLTLGQRLVPDTFEARLEYTETVNGPWAELARFPLYFRFESGFIHENDPRSMGAWNRKEVIETTLPNGSGSKSFIKA